MLLELKQTRPLPLILVTCCWNWKKTRPLPLMLIICCWNSEIYSELFQFYFVVTNISENILLSLKKIFQIECAGNSNWRQIYIVTSARLCNLRNVITFIVTMYACNQINISLYQCICIRSIRDKFDYEWAKRTKLL